MEREQKKLLYLVRPAAGGMREHLRLLIKHFSSRYSTHLAAPRSEGERQAWEAEARGLAAEIIPLPLQEGLSPARDLLSLGLLVRLLRRMRPSLLHIHGFKAALIGGPAALIAGVPAVVTVHNFPAHRGKALLPPLMRLQDREQTHFIAVSRALARGLERWGIPPSRISVIYNGIDPAPFVKDSRDRFTGEEKIVGTVARLAPQKGLPYFLQAAALLAAAYPGLRFLVVGEGPERRRLEQLASRLGLNSRLQFLGYCPDLPRQLARMDVLLLPSLTEGQSITILEAMASRCPVVASQVGGVPEIIRDGENGLLVPPGNAAALAAAVSSLLANPDRARRMARSAQQEVCRNFTAAAMLQRTEEVYRELAGDA
ncbi:MAG TPA: glycosyltransferase family 4 protein [Bacillota bacterium]|jgi:glycosyltransferase involved in cell wall biosynthesis|nr:glycosyltransferase family 4 protein [Bacillota bacterium]HOB87823.1 glycosyltransferase family 4 protein [Bacillota bacterium]